MQKASPDESFQALLTVQLARSGRQLKEIAERAGITDGYLSLLRTGKRKAPPLKVVRDIGLALELGTVELNRLCEAAEADRVGKSEDRLAPRERYRAVSALGKPESAPAANEYLTWSTPLGSLTIEIFSSERLVKISLRPAGTPHPSSGSEELKLAMYAGQAAKPYHAISMPVGSRHETQLRPGINRLEFEWINATEEGDDRGGVTFHCKVR